MKIKDTELSGIQRKKILIVEDDEDNAFMTENTLRNYFETSTVKNGYEAVEALNKNNYDAVLMDINLGDGEMDGLRTLRLIKQNSKHKFLKIFAMTEFSSAREWYKENGFEDLFAKPILYKKIVGVINNSLTVNKVSRSLFLRAS